MTSVHKEVDPPSSTPTATAPPAKVSRLRRLLLGAPRNIQDPNVYHHISLIAFLAWVGLGADGLSSSAYGPEETFRAIGEHHYVAVSLALATTLTVLIISLAWPTRRSASSRRTGTASSCRSSSRSSAS